MTPQQIQGIGMTSQRTRNRLLLRLRERGITDEKVLETMASVPRHLFVDEALASRSYEDTALPIGNGQTLSQPYVVARMTELLLAAGSPQRVLEVGTGSGYQTAILSHLVEEVFSVERIEPLLARARLRFAALGYRNIHLAHADGGWGWVEEAPFDAIMVTAAAETVPDALLQQLRPQGRLVLPVGRQDGEQVLMLLSKDEKGVHRQALEAVRFVPLLEGLI
ncbi:MAG: protein-L-isoaspartate(D-aspartate) O-methyltransferase [Gammaproteobacteria bacterium]|nr:protein-L-isoaspartate(D-aspartate) O-methyltransferase [Gammaproteobacteria bacterium]